jgi:hypothetical protein
MAEFASVGPSAMAAISEATTKAEAEVEAAADKLLQAQAKKKLKVEAAAAAEKKRLAGLAAKWKEPGPLKLPNLPGMKVCNFLVLWEQL